MHSSAHSHTGLRIAWAPCYAHPLPEGHRFPMEKYNLIPEQLRHEGLITEDNLFEPQPIAVEDILRVHSLDYWERFRDQRLTAQEMRRTGFPHSPELVHRERVIGQGTLDCARIALREGVALNVSGGTHHAFSDRGEGFCLLNDMAMAAAALVHEDLARQVLILDLDVHQGNGTAQIFRQEPRVFTFSMHCRGNYPHVREQSDWDIEVDVGTEDAAYLRLLRETLPALLDRVQPDFCFYLSGVDVLATDKLGKLRLSRAGCRERDRMVLERLHRDGIPVAMAMGGGYSHHLRDIVEAHCNTFRTAAELWY